MSSDARRNRASLAGRIEIYGLVLGAVLGGIGGLVVGLASYWRTAPFAVVEGAIFGLVIGTAAACVPALVVLLSALTLRR